MSRRTSERASPKPANLSINQMKIAIPQLERRLKELQEFNPQEAARDNTKATSLEDKIDATLLEIFGDGTIEYLKYKIYSLYSGGIIITGGGRNSYHDSAKPYTDGKQEAISKIETIISLFKEKISDTESRSGISSPLSLSGLDLHPSIQAASGSRYNSGHFSDAVEAACKALNAAVQSKSGNYDYTKF